MTHRGWGLIACGVAAVMLASGCGGGTPPTSPTPDPTGSGSPSASATAEPSPSTTPTIAPPADPATVFAADGIGPYVIGSTLADLTSRSLLVDVVDSELCTDVKSASATGRYSGALSFTFKGGTLTAIHTTSTDLVTPSGARVGMTLAELESIYGTRGTLITGTLGNKAFAVRVPTSVLGIVFYLDPTNTRVASMSAGNADDLEDAARAGEGC